MKEEYYSGRQKLEAEGKVEEVKNISDEETPAKIFHEGREVQGMFRTNLARIWGKSAAKVGNKTRNTNWDDLKDSEFQIKEFVTNKQSEKVGSI